MLANVQNCRENWPAVHNIHTAYSKGGEKYGSVLFQTVLQPTTHREMTSQFLRLYLVGLPLPKTAEVLLIYANNTEWQH